MSQPEPLQAAELPPSISLDERLRALDVADDKIGEILESTRVILENLVKDGKAMPRNKMDENLKKNTRLLEDEVHKVIQDQLSYMEQMCVGAEHQGSVFSWKDSHETYQRTLDNVHKELEALAPSQEDEETATAMLMDTT